MLVILLFCFSVTFYYLLFLHFKVEDVCRAVVAASVWFIILLESLPYLVMQCARIGLVIVYSSSSSSVVFICKLTRFENF